MMEIKKKCLMFCSKNSIFLGDSKLSLISKTKSFKQHDSRLIYSDGQLFCWFHSSRRSIQTGEPYLFTFV